MSSLCSDVFIYSTNRSLSELEAIRVGGDMGEKIRQVTERATLFRITSNAMINVSYHSVNHNRETCFTATDCFTDMCSCVCLLHKACRDFLSLAQNHSKRWQKALQTERDQRIRLEETLEQLAKQHNHLERAFRGATVLPSSFSNPALGSKGTSLYHATYWHSSNMV